MVFLALTTIYEDDHTMIPIRFHNKYYGIECSSDMEVSVHL